MVRTTRLALAAIAVLMLGVGSASADGALVVGSTGDLGGDGVAMGYTVNFPSRSEAISEATKECRNYPAPKAAARCQLAGTFRNECVAVALDPEPGRTGTGWSFGPTKAIAQERALSVCRATANPGREGACAIIASECDVSR